MLKCREIPARASDFIDREGSARENLAVALHLLLCSRCRDYVRGMKIASRVSAASLRDDVPDELFRTLGLKAPDRDGRKQEPDL
jgi:predicted anti-sigma-YlaC factor YlaD